MSSRRIKAKTAVLDAFPESRSQSLAIARFARAAVKLASTGAIVAMGLSLSLGVPRSFVVRNSLPADDRWRLLLAILLGAFLPVLLAGVVALATRGAALRWISRVASMVRPALPLGFLPLLMVPSLWFRNPLPFLVVLAVLTLLLEDSVRDALTALGRRRKTRPPLSAAVPTLIRRWAPVATVVLAAACYTVFTFYYSVQQHQRLSSSAYDLGIYDNLMFNAMHGHPFRSPVLLGPDGGSYLQGHAEFAMLLFVPLYALHPSAVTLLGLQAVLLGFAAIPLYLFVRRQVSPWSGVVLATCYLLFAPLHGASFYDFHWLPLAIFFHFWLYLGIAARKPWLIGVTWVILVLIREDVSVGLVFLGLFLVVTGLRPKLGLFFAVANTLTFALIKFGIMHSMGQFVFASMIYGDLVAPGEKGFTSVIKTLLTNPMYLAKTLLVEKKLILVLHLFAPLAFLPLRRLSLGLLVAGACFFTLLTTSYPPTISIRFQYPTHWIPYLFAATAIMLGWLSRGRHGVIRRRAALTAIVFAVTTHSYCFGAILQHETFVGGFAPLRYKLKKSEQRRYEGLRKLVAQMPVSASVAAGERLVPHVSNREWVYTLRTHHGEADYLLMSAPLSAREKNHATRALKQFTYGLVDSAEGLYLLKREHHSPKTAAALKRLGLRSSAK